MIGYHRTDQNPPIFQFPSQFQFEKPLKTFFGGKNLQIKLSKKWSAKVIKVPIKVTLDKFKIRILLIWKIRLSKFIVIGEMIADHDRDRLSWDFQIVIVSDRRSWFCKMIVSDRRSQKKWSSPTLHFWHTNTYTRCWCKANLKKIIFSLFRKAMKSTWI